VICKIFVINYDYKNNHINQLNHIKITVQASFSNLMPAMDWRRAGEGVKSTRAPLILPTVNSSAVSTPSLENCLNCDLYDYFDFIDLAYIFYWSVV
jgi:hypothetical protein